MNVGSLPPFVVGKMFYVSPPPLTKFCADRHTLIEYNKLIPSTTRPFKVLEGQNHVLPVDISRIAGTVSIDRATQVSSEQPQRLLTSRRKRRHTSNLHKACKRDLVDHQIVRHRQTTNVLQYENCWYGYEVKDETFEPPSNIPLHLIPRYWGLQKWQQSSIVVSFPSYAQQTYRYRAEENM